MDRRYLAAVIALAIVFTACGSSGSRAPAPERTIPEDEAASAAASGPATGGAAAERPAPTPAAARPVTGPATTVNVTVTGGPRAGSYSASSRETICSLGIVTPGGWGVAYTDANMQAARPEAFTSFGFSGGKDQPDGVRDSEDFTANVQFGPLGASTVSYVIKPAGKLGRGTATVEARGGSATVTVRGETKDGVKIDARVECNAVLRF